MELQYKDRYYTGRPERKVSVAEYIASKADRYGPEGAIEAAQHTANKTLEALGRLVEILADKGILDADHVVKIADSFDEDVRFAPEPNY